MGYVFINVIYQIRHVWQDQVYDWYLKWYKVSITLISVDRYEAIWSSNNWHWSVLKHPPIRILDIKYLSDMTHPWEWYPWDISRGLETETTSSLKSLHVFRRKCSHHCCSCMAFFIIIFIVIILNFIITYHNFDIIECKAASDLILIGKLKLKRKGKFIHSIKIWICLPK